MSLSIVIKSVCFTLGNGQPVCNPKMSTPPGWCFTTLQRSTCVSPQHWINPCFTERCIMSHKKSSYVLWPLIHNHVNPKGQLSRCTCTFTTKGHLFCYTRAKGQSVFHPLPTKVNLYIKSKDQTITDEGHQCLYHWWQSSADQAWFYM